VGENELYFEDKYIDITLCDVIVEDVSVCSNTKDRYPCFLWFL